MFMNGIKKAVKALSALFSAPAGNVPESSPDTSTGGGAWKVAYIEVDTRGTIRGGHIPHSGRGIQRRERPRRRESRPAAARLESVRAADIKETFKEWKQNIADYDRVRALMA